MPRPRVHIRLPTNLHARLCEEAGKPGASKAKIVEAALSSWFDPEARQSLEDRLLVRLDRFDERQSGIERDVAFTFEVLTQYILYWLARTEPLPDGERDAAQALGQRRFDHFIDQVARKLADVPQR
ncbi:hypothetical protein [Henriciella aquimarina]|uniref:hypothetical protein n=1 Tax=Henriciella aquimarina TaxID=545261 RepID=UPI000A0614AA|nr:hypothetical protein [Henriciella aquimarina]